jgi:hypothetical protein
MTKLLDGEKMDYGPRMIISPGRQYIFVHIPKTGGTSMALALENRAHRDDILIGDTPKAQKRRGRVKGRKARGRLWKHATLADIDGVVTAAQMEQMFCFTIVRNPWDRAVSYYHWLRGQSFDHDAVRLAKAHDFSEFLRHPHTVMSLQNAPYTRYMQDVSGVERGQFLRLEHLGLDMAPLVRHLGFRPEIPHENRSERGAYQDYYDADLRDHLGRICAGDIARFDYRF